MLSLCGVALIGHEGFVPSSGGLVLIVPEEFVPS